MERRVAVILLGAGRGSRLGAGGSKALIELGGRSMVCWSARSLCQVPGVVRLVLVVPAGEEGPRIAEACAELAPEVRVVEGGARRRDSVAAGLAVCGDVDLVLVHDAARPFASTELAERVLVAAAARGAAVPAIAVGDTLVRAEGDAIGERLERGELRAVQTPQGFRLEGLARAHEGCPPEWDASDDGSMVQRLGEPVALVEGEQDNFKVTWPGDLERARGLARRRSGAEDDEVMQLPRIGFGWDVHPLREGRPFRLLGVDLDADFGPEGHSDGDPLSHAVADALLGAAGAGDIGMLFPDTDPRYAGMPGAELLRETVLHLDRRGWRPAQVDAVVILDAPKIAPYRDAIRARLAEILGLPSAAVSVKGKRTEGLGGLSGGAGVGCQAVATLVQGG